MVLDGVDAIERARVQERLRQMFKAEDFQDLATTKDLFASLEPVRWGDRMYLVPPSQAVRFCQAIADGTEPRGVSAGVVFLRKGDDRKPPSVNRPELCELLSSPLRR